MLMPKKTKYRRLHRLSYEGKAKGQTRILNGNYGLVAQQGHWISNRQIEAARIAMTRHLKREGKVF
ncbi:large ribosomal subunit protein uL16, partial [Candidatus Phytoplasma citri]